MSSELTLRRRIGGALAGALVGALPLLVVSILRPGYRAVALDVYLLYLGGVLLLALVQATRDSGHRDPHAPFTRALRKRQPARERLQQLVRQEREVGLSLDAAFDLHVRLRPTLRMIASHRLAAKCGIDLARQPERAREVLGEEAWELVRPGRPVPEDRFARGISLERLRTIVDSLERM